MSSDDALRHRLDKLVNSVESQNVQYVKAASFGPGNLARGLKYKRHIPKATVYKVPVAAETRKTDSR